MGAVPYTRRNSDPFVVLGRRILLMLGILGILYVILWSEREGLRDSTKPEGEPFADLNFNGQYDPGEPFRDENGNGTHDERELLGPLDTLYFLCITVQTVGYGDIVPVSGTARMVDAIIVWIVRLSVWAIFLNTVFNFTIRQLSEDYTMDKLRKRLDRHVIITGFGVTGSTAAAELVLKGTAPDQIVVLDMDEDAVREAAGKGFVALRGDATQEDVLRDAVVEKASHLIITTGRDDTSLLISLTARDLNRSLTIATECVKEENSKLLRRGGADMVISPAVSGGHLLAASITSPGAVAVMQDLLTSGGALALDQRPVTPEEAGVSLADLAPAGVIALIREGRILPVVRAGRTTVREGDEVIVLEPCQPPDRTPGTGPDADAGRSGEESLTTRAGATDQKTPEAGENEKETAGSGGEGSEVVESGDDGDSSQPPDEEDSAEDGADKSGENDGGTKADEESPESSEDSEEEDGEQD